MNSCVIRDHVIYSNIEKYQTDSHTIVPMIQELKRDMESLFDYEKDWDVIWELIQIVLQQVGYESYCVEPFIRDIYERSQLPLQDTRCRDMKNLEYVKSLDLPEQRTPEWFEFRQTRLTASELSYCVNAELNSKVAEQMVQKKLHPNSVPYMSSAATSHGTMFEPVAQYVYESIHHCRLQEFGCVPHKNISWLAASPDGITETGVMVEIKCPYSRSPMGVPSLTYYTQIQAQLEVCDLEWCDFMECEITTYEGRTQYIMDTITKEEGNAKGLVKTDFYRKVKREYIPKKGLLKGVAIILQTNGGPRYDCIDLEAMRCQKSTDWIQETLNRRYSEGAGVSGYTVVYWILKQVWMTRIERNSSWFTTIMNKAEEFWRHIEQKKEEGMKPPQRESMEFVEETL